VHDFQKELAPFAPLALGFLMVIAGILFFIIRLDLLIGIILIVTGFVLILSFLWQNCDQIPGQLMKINKSERQVREFISNGVPSLIRRGGVPPGAAAFIVIDETNLKPHN
jgi:hypothetical protein